MIIISIHATGALAEEITLSLLPTLEGDAILIESTQTNVLIDTGSKESFALYKDYLPDMLTCLIITHPHPDHFGAFEKVLSSIEVLYIFENEDPQAQEIPEYKNILEHVNKKALTLLPSLCNGKYFSFKKIWPDTYTHDLNSNSLVLQTLIHSTKVLLTGDLNIDSEKVLLKRNKLSKIDILKIGHHAADDSSSLEFLQRTQPDIALLSPGSKNPWGYPSRVTLNRFLKQKIPIHRSSHQKIISLAITSQGYRIEN